MTTHPALATASPAAPSAAPSGSSAPLAFSPVAGVFAASRFVAAVTGPCACVDTHPTEPVAR